MKVRWTRSSLRLRIDDLELATLRRGGEVREVLLLPGGELSARLKVGRRRLELRGGDLTVELDAAELDLLAHPDHEGVEREGPPRLFVEKDFLPMHGGGT